MDVPKGAFLTLMQLAVRLVLALLDAGETLRRRHEPIPVT